MNKTCNMYYRRLRIFVVTDLLERKCFMYEGDVVKFYCSFHIGYNTFEKICKEFMILK